MTEWQDKPSDAPVNQNTALTPKKSGAWIVWVVVGSVTGILIAVASFAFSFFLGSDDVGV